MCDASIAVFDSGLGGLTVLKEVMRALPHENILYFGDMARVPYGGRSPKTIIRYALENVRFLMQRPIKCLVVACHTVSAYALQDLQREFSIPVLGVIEPLVQEVFKKNPKRILILATQATIASNIYPTRILEKDPKMEIFSIAAPLFVPLVEEGLGAHLATDLIVKEYFRQIEGQNIDAAILGCTHYPLIREAIQKGLGEKVLLIESGAPTAKALCQLLEKEGLLSQRALGKLSFIVTDQREKFCRLASDFLGQAIDLEDVEEVDVAVL
jgi:glutamate racemase